MNVSMGEKSNEIIQFRERKLTATSKLQKQQKYGNMTCILVLCVIDKK